MTTHDAGADAKPELSDVQGLVVSGFASMPEAAFLLLEIGDPDGARRWLRDLADRLTTGAAPEESRCLNVAITGAGLSRLGVGVQDLRTFPAPLREGMAAPYRQRVLGDVEGSAPEHWEWGGPAGSAGSVGGDRVHVLLLVYAADAATLADVVAQERAAIGTDGALVVVHELRPEPLPGVERLGKFGVEHFGFADGMSQPVIDGTPQADQLSGQSARRNVIATGEFVLGYPNGYGLLTPFPRLRPAAGDEVDVGRNGSYLVLRQLEQDVAGFRRFVRTNADAGDDPDAVDRFAAKIVGRWRSGAPLVESWHRDDPDLGEDNGFGYHREDPDGQRCPLGAHIRRTNPRDSLGSDPAKSVELANLHRIMRRGRVYGPALPDDVETDDGHPRGLIFMAVNANLERQFEFVQQSWSNNPTFAGLYDEQDPLLGTPPPQGGTFTVQAAPLARRVHGLPGFVTVRGGAYFFLPGIRGARALAGV